MIGLHRITVLVICSLVINRASSTPVNDGNALARRQSANGNIALSTCTNATFVDGNTFQARCKPLGNKKKTVTSSINLNGCITNSDGSMEPLTE